MRPHGLGPASADTTAYERTDRASDMQMSSANDHSDRRDELSLCDLVQSIERPYAVATGEHSSHAVASTYWMPW